MTNNKSKFFIIIIAVLIVAVIISTYALVKTSSEDETYNISVVVEDSQNEKWNSFRQGIESAAADTGALIDYVNTSNFKDVNEELSLLNDQIQKNANAVITELVQSGGTADQIKDISGKAVLALVGTDADTDIDIEGKFATISPDNYQIGRALGNEVLLRHQKDLSNLRIGIICSRMGTYRSKDRLNGLFDVLAVKKAEPAWCVVLSGEGGDELLKNRAFEMSIFRNELNETNYTLVKKIYRQSPVDIIVSIDDDSLQVAAELYGEIENAFGAKSSAYKYKTDENGKMLPPYELYGEGASVRNISYLDRGRIVSMIVPNEYSMGYRAVEKVVSKLNHKLTPMKDDMVEYRVINQENMFDDDNQKYLFTTMQ